ncbi:zinc-ribbon domain-containing protein [Methanobrevibacter sp.]|uniref:zinc-ribbon domain-containing protein n=1 Tax=Methanobrevibacter sp. TaxID=66852 RepID=UPI00389098D1
MARKCKNCGEIINDDSLFCSKCGNYIRRSGFEKTYPVKWIGVALLCIFLVVFSGFMLSSNDTKVATSLNMISSSQFEYWDTFSVQLTDESGNALADRFITVAINDNTYTLKTDSNGTASINLTLTDGSYTVNSDFRGDDVYGESHSSDVVVV